MYSSLRLWGFDAVTAAYLYHSLKKQHILQAKYLKDAKRVSFTKNNYRCAPVRFDAQHMASLLVDAQGISKHRPSVHALRLCHNRQQLLESTVVKIYLRTEHVD